MKTFSTKAETLTETLKHAPILEENNSTTSFTPSRCCFQRNIHAPGGQRTLLLVTSHLNISPWYANSRRLNRPSPTLIPPYLAIFQFWIETTSPTCILSQESVWSVQPETHHHIVNIHHYRKTPMGRASSSTTEITTRSQSSKTPNLPPVH